MGPILGFICALAIAPNRATSNTKSDRGRSRGQEIVCLQRCIKHSDLLKDEARLGGRREGSQAEDAGFIFKAPHRQTRAPAVIQRQPLENDLPDGPH